MSLHLHFPGEFLADPGQRAGFVLLVAFLLSFLFIRTSARLIRNPRVTWWPGNVETASGLHLHHLVWGILLMTVSGFLGFAMNQQSPTAEILAGFFGVGAGLTFDEFALWVHLRDVYWSEEGRTSLAAFALAILLGALVILGAGPFDLPQNETSLIVVCVSIVIDLLLCAITILKGKPLLGVIGIFIPVCLFVGAIRLASPESYWGRRRYRAGSRKLARAQARWQRIRARRRRIGNLIAGAPQAADTSEPLDQPRERAGSGRT